MSLVQQCLESFGTLDYGHQLSTEEAAKYTIEDGAFLINMESTVALSEMYSLEYEMETAYVESCAEAKELGVPVEEGIGSALSKVKSKLGDLCKRAKDWFVKMKAKLIGWYNNVKKSIREMFAKPKSIVQDIDESAVECHMEGNDLVITSTDSNSSGSPTPATPAPTPPAPTPARKAPAPTAKKPAAKKVNVVYVRDFKVFKYTHMDDYPEAVKDIYERIQTNTISPIETLIKEEDARYQYFRKKSFELQSNREAKGRKKLDIGTLHYGAAAAADKPIKLFLGKINREGEEVINKYFGGKDVDPAKFAYGYFRNGAKSEDDKRQPDNSRSLISTARAALKENNLEKEMTRMQSTVSNHFDKMINKLKEWENRLKDRNTGSSDVASAVNGLISLCSTMQSRMNIMTNAWIAANKERLAVYSQVIVKVKAVQYGRRAAAKNKD